MLSNNLSIVNLMSSNIFDILPRELIFAIGILSSISIILSVFSIWRIFSKSGTPGILAFIPIVNLFVFADIVYGKWFMGFLFLVPGVNLLFIPITNYKLSDVYGQSTFFCVMSIFFSPITTLILGLGNAEYHGPLVEKMLTKLNKKEEKEAQKQMQLEERMRQKSEKKEKLARQPKERSVKENAVARRRRALAEQQE